MIEKMKKNRTPVEQQLKLINFDLTLDVSHESEDELSEEDDQWALVLMRVYRAKVPINKSNLPTDPISARREA
jgi:hypothetical protein